MDYKLGVVGLGHWFGWLKTGLGEGKGLELVSAVGTRPFDDKKELLDSFGITRENYYTTDKRGVVPEQFFNTLDMVHISDPNTFHADQAIQSLGHGKYTVVEKTLASNKAQFSRISSYVRKNNYTDKLYLHLHYMHKQPTIMLASMLKELVKKNGKIKSVQATFFEEEREDDIRRKWLFSKKNGGIFMDWIHPFEIIYASTKCKFGSITELKNLSVNSVYTQDYPTGVEATLEISGKAYSKDAKMTSRVAKGVGKDQVTKAIKLVFESGNSLFMVFPGHEAEFNGNYRGKFELVDPSGNIVMSKELTGKNTSEIFVAEIIDMAAGDHRGLKIKDIARIFKPQWEYQKMLKNSELIKDRAVVEQFVREGISETQPAQHTAPNQN